MEQGTTPDTFLNSGAHTAVLLAGRDLLLREDIAAILADRREDNLGDPVLEGLRLGSVAPHDELVEGAL